MTFVCNALVKEELSHKARCLALINIFGAICELIVEC